MDTGIDATTATQSEKKQKIDRTAAKLPGTCCSMTIAGEVPSKSGSKEDQMNDEGLVMVHQFF